jgi:membrane fusion protein (multidrug efflux system)
MPVDLPMNTARDPDARGVGPVRAAALTALLVLFACQRPVLPPTEVAQTPPPEFLVDVEAVAVQRGSIAQRIFAPGSLVARRESRIGTEVQGRILHVHVFEGDRIEKGQPLFEIDPDSWQVGLRQAEAGLDLARAERVQLEADLARAQALRRQNVLAEQEIERLTTALAVARARERQVSEAVNLARHNLERTVVRAPYAGSIAARLADEGTTALVQPQTIVVVLQETAELEAHAAIPEGQMALVRLGDDAFIRVEGFPDPIETGVSAVSDTIDPATRTYLVKMRVPNSDYRLKAGVFAHVEIVPQTKSDVILVPREAIATENGRTRVLVVRDGEAVTVPVEIGLASEEHVEVVRGIETGELVIVGDAARTIAPGMRVRIQSQPPEQTS